MLHRSHSLSFLHLPMNGVLILSARSGQLYFSKAFVPDFGIRNTDVDPDAVQLNSYDASYIAGLLFALHLNVTELAEDGDDSSAMLKCFESESTRLYFEHEARQHVLCVAFVQPCIGSDAARLMCRAVLNNFSTTFPDVSTARKFSTFQPVLRSVLLDLLTEFGRRALNANAPWFYAVHSDDVLAEMNGRSRSHDVEAANQLLIQSSLHNVPCVDVALTTRTFPHRPVQSTAAPVVRPRRNSLFACLAKMFDDEVPEVIAPTVRTVEQLVGPSRLQGQLQAASFTLSDADVDRIFSVALSAAKLFTSLGDAVQSVEMSLQINSSAQRLTVRRMQSVFIILPLRPSFYESVMRVSDQWATFVAYFAFLHDFKLLKRADEKAVGLV